MNIREWNPQEGGAFQGDVCLWPVPANIEISTLDEIAPRDRRLVLLDGEISGHAHAISLDPSFGRAKNFRPADASVADPFAAASPALRKRLAGGTAAKVNVRMYRDAAAAQAMVKAGILERADLMVGFLVIDGEPVVLRHQEHDPIRIPAGTYYCGRQVESVGAEERRVAD
jgi:hypothetical protein